MPGKIVEARHRLKPYWQVGVCVWRALRCVCVADGGAMAAPALNLKLLKPTRTHAPFAAAASAHRQAEGASRDLLLLDIALDSYLRLSVERMDKGAMAGAVRECGGWDGGGGWVQGCGGAVAGQGLC